MLNMTALCAIRIYLQIGVANFYLAIFHHIIYHFAMKVVENDNLVHQMLREELKRCINMSASLVKMLAGLPKGSLHVRHKRYKGKKYKYHYLKYREGGKSISKHISDSDLDKLSKQLDARKKYLKELVPYRERIKYLEKIVSVKK